MIRVSITVFDAVAKESAFPKGTEPIHFATISASVISSAALSAEATVGEALNNKMFPDGVVQMAFDTRRILSKTAPAPGLSTTFDKVMIDPSLSPEAYAEVSTVGVTVINLT